MIQLKQILSKLEYKTLIIVILAVILLVVRMCSSGDQTSHPTVKIDGKKYEQVQHKVDTVVVTKNVVVYRPGKTIYSQPLPPTTPPTSIKKDSIVKQYYGVTVYKDTVKLKDNQGYVSVTDTVTQNKIVGRLWNAHINTTTIHDNNIVKELPKTQLYIGAVMGFDKANVVNFAGPSLLLKTKQDHIYSLGVGYSNTKALSIQGGIYWKIKLGK